MKRILCVLALLLGSSAAMADGSSNYNFRFSPIGLIVGSFNVNMDIAVAPDWTVGPELNYWRFSLGSSSGFTSKYDITAFGFGARANWFKNGNFTSGLYVGPSLGYTSVKVETSDSGGSVTGKANALMAACLVGYGWYWDSFNMMLGGGLSAGLGDTKVTVTDSSGSDTKVSTNIAGLAAEFSLGWTF